MKVPVLGICYGQQTLAAQARRHGRDLGPPRVRPRLRGRHRRVRHHPRRLGARRARAGLDEPRRPHHAPSPRLPRRGEQRGRALRRHRRRRAPLLRHHVPPGGRPHAARLAAPAQLRPRRLRLPRRLDHGRLPRRGGGAIRAQVGKRQGHLRPFGRRRLRPSRRCCSTRRSATSSPASSSTTASCAPARRRRWTAPSATASTSAWSTATRATCSSRRWPGSPTRRRSARPSATSSWRCSRRSRRRSAAPTSWRRARSTPT